DILRDRDRGRVVLSGAVKCAQTCLSPEIRILEEREGVPIVVAHPVAPVSVQNDGQTVTISGGAKQLSLLGRNIAWLAEHADASDPSDDIHPEHIRDSDHYIAAYALPLIVRP